MKKVKAKAIDGKGYDNIVFINDLHLTTDSPIGRLDDIRATGLRKLKFVLDWAYEHRAFISIAGDMTDKPRSWGLVTELLREITIDDDIYVVYGQHDTYMYSEESRDATILGILALEKKVKILSHIPEHPLPFIDLYGCHYGQVVPVPDYDAGERINILSIHAPIAEKALWITQDYMDAGKFLTDHSDYGIIHCGDIHQKFMVQKKDQYIINSGPMLRLEATPYNFKHKPGFWVWNIKGARMSWVEIPHEDAEKVLTRDHIELTEMANEVLKEFIDSVKTDIGEGASSIISNLWSIIRENDIQQDVIDVIAETIGKERMRNDG